MVVTTLACLTPQRCAALTFSEYSALTDAQRETMRLRGDPIPAEAPVKPTAPVEAPKQGEEPSLAANTTAGGRKLLGDMGTADHNYHYYFGAVNNENTSMHMASPCWFSYLSRQQEQQQQQQQ